MRRHAPDFFARVAGGGALVVDSRALDRIGERDREAFAAAGAACAQVGWRYAVWDAAEAVPTENLRAGRVCQIFCARGFLLSGSGCLSGTFYSRYLLP